MSINLQVKQYCIEMGLEFVKPIKEVGSKEIVYIVYDPKQHDEMLYSYEEIQNLYNSFIER